MREQSQKREMSEALREDFRRLRARGIATTLAPAIAEETATPALDPALEPPTEAANRAEDAERPRVPVLARLLGRR
jgi:hypothetical protein